MVNHIHNIVVEASCNYSFTNLKLVSPSLKETAYFTLGRHQLEYAAVVWSPWLNKDIAEIERVMQLSCHQICL